jgi:cell division protein ZapE
MANLLDHYDASVAGGDITKDAEQRKAAKALDRLYIDLTKKKSFFEFRAKPVMGVYVHGGVGRGKSMLMDLFYNALPDHFKKRRVHFHAFMIKTHNWLHKARGDQAVDDLLPKYAKYVSDNVRVLCFDEFHVTDVADAMILSRLFTALFDYGVAIVATSNWKPDRLYEGGLQRDRFLPFIALVKERMDVVHLDSDTDYREEAVQDLETYLYPLNETTHDKIERFFIQLSGGVPEHHHTMTVKGRDFPVLSAAGVARFTFVQLCEQPHGAEDYLTIAGQFHTVFIEGIPKLGYDRRNETKRLMTLIDVLYDTRRRVIVSAEAAPEKLYHGHDHKFEFDRTISRLKEMQSSSYLVNPV